MELFRPSKNIMDKITSFDKTLGEHNPLIYYHVLDNQGNEYFDSSIISATFETIRSYYRIALEEHRGRLSTQRTGMIVVESLKNCINHSPNGRYQTVMGGFLGDRGLCFGFYDGGDYFKNEEIKHQYENKITVKEFDKNPFGETRGHGVNGHIFPFSDFIEVDSKKGILYCGQLKENFIAPEGENGNQYFYRKFEE